MADGAARLGQFTDVPACVVGGGLVAALRESASASRRSQRKQASAAVQVSHKQKRRTQVNSYRGLLLASLMTLAMPLVGRAADIPVPSPGASSRIDTIKQRGSLRVAVFDEYPWLKQTTDAEAPFAGPARRLAEEYAKRLGVKIETTSVSQSSKVPILLSGQVDITIAPLLETPERDKLVDFVIYSVSAQCLFGLADNPKLERAGSIDDLNRPDIMMAYTTGTPQGS